MPTPKTNRDLLSQGLKTMVGTLLVMFVGPTLLHIGLSNPDKPLHLPLVIVGIGLCGYAIYLGFKGIRTLLKSLFGDA